jgi:regulator of RNase E activity RraA
MTSLWNNDDELFDLIRKELFSALLGDVMDHLGFRRQFLPPQIQPLRDDMVVVGRAMTVLEADVFEAAPQGGVNALLAQPFGLLFHALDDLKPNEVYICSGGTPHYALWGELMATRAKKLGAAGAVLNGYSRDTPGVLALNLPVFSYGRYAQDQGPRGKVIDYRVPIEIEGVRIVPGDLIIGDLDGVCIVPQSHETEIVTNALEKNRKEKKVLEAIESGMSAVDAWNTYGVF